MRKIVLAIFDVQAQCFSNPLFVAARGVGLRIIGDEVNRADPQNNLHVHPADFRVFELGEWDDASGLFSAKGLPELVCDVVSLKLTT